MDVKVVEVVVEVVPEEEVMVEETAVGEEAGVEVAREEEAMVKETAVEEEAVGENMAGAVEEDVAVVDLGEDAVVVVREDVAVLVMNHVLVKGNTAATVDEDVVAVDVGSHCVTTWTSFARSRSALRRRVCPRQKPSVLPARNG